MDIGGLPAHDKSPPPPTCRMFLTWKNKLKCRVILDAREVNWGDPRPPPPPPSSVCRVWRGYTDGWGRRLEGGGGSPSTPGLP